ncbi:MAG: DNA alkylation repair protein [Prevotella sp.]|jgi:3-methyladenine DNA glycosylase AlkD|nr:DNA alkylation repair protein [Prevotella sp.]
MNTEEVIKDIRRRCCLAMNGIVSANMRSYGLNYKVNFGVSLQKIREMAGYYQPSAALAGALWQEYARELKILATLLFPVEDFDRNTAETWLAGICNQEIREQVCLNLFQKLPFAETLACEWGNSEDESVRTTGYWLLVRLLLAGKTTAGNCNHLFADLTSENVSLRNAALLLLKRLGCLSKTAAEEIMNSIASFQNASDPVMKEIFDSLNFEFEYRKRKMC